jgi:hypothetical protein
MAWNTQFAMLTFLLGVNWFGISELQGLTGSPVNILNYAKMVIHTNFCMYVCVFYVEDVFACGIIQGVS